MEVGLLFCSFFWLSLHLKFSPYIWCFWSIKFLSYYYLIFLFIIQIASERDGDMDKNEPLLTDTNQVLAYFIDFAPS